MHTLTWNRAASPFWINQSPSCAETLALIAEGKLDTTPLITHTYPLSDIAAAYDLFENRRDNVIKVAIKI